MESPPYAPPPPSFLRTHRGFIVVVVLGVALLIIVVSGLTWLSYPQYIPKLSSKVANEPGGWESESPQNPAWTSSHLPVFFSYLSIACPYCSASSWPILQAVDPSFGALSNYTYCASDPNDVFPNTPCVNFAGSRLASSYLSWDVKEGTDDYSTSDLPALSWQEQDYVNEYDGAGGIPFIVIGGIFVHTGTLVDPSVLANGSLPLTPQQVTQDLENPGSDPAVYDAVQNATLYLEAYLVKADQIGGIAPPTSMTSSEAVMNIVALIH